MPTKEELQDKLNAAYEDVDRLLKQVDAKDWEMAQLEGKLTSVKGDFECLAAERDELETELDSKTKEAGHYQDYYHLEKGRADKLAQKLKIVKLQAEAYLTYIATLRAEVDRDTAE
jgi:chromosome segregation ATPase